MGSGAPAMRVLDDDEVDDGIVGSIITSLEHSEHAAPRPGTTWCTAAGSDGARARWLASQADAMHPETAACRATSRTGPRLGGSKFFFFFFFFFFQKSKKTIHISISIPSTSTVQHAPLPKCRDPRVGLEESVAVARCQHPGGARPDHALPVAVPGAGPQFARGLDGRRGRHNDAPPGVAQGPEHGEEVHKHGKVRHNHIAAYWWW
jgi:hypothetical protein